LHAIGPVVSDKQPTEQNRNDLKLCYTNSLQYLLTKSLKSIVSDRLVIV